MNVSPVVFIDIPFSGDNHRDVKLEAETEQTITGVATLVSLMQQLKSAGLEDKVTFMTLNVFGRTLAPGNEDGRTHNDAHQVSLTIGKPFRGGVIGAVGPVAPDYGALPIDSKSGAGRADGEYSPARYACGVCTDRFCRGGGRPVAGYLAQPNRQGDSARAGVSYRLAARRFTTSSAATRYASARVGKLKMLSTKASTSRPAQSAICPT